MDIFVDPLDQADIRRAELKHVTACGKCNSPDPARIAEDGCSDCTEFDRCPLCRRWIGEGFAAPVIVFLDGAEQSVCEPCFFRQSPTVALDYREAV